MTVALSWGSCRPGWTTSVGPVDTRPLDSGHLQVPECQVADQCQRHRVHDLTRVSALLACQSCR